MIRESRSYGLLFNKELIQHKAARSTIFEPLCSDSALIFFYFNQLQMVHAGKTLCKDINAETDV